MPRNSCFEVLNDTSLYDTRQMLPRGVLSLTMSAWVHWAHDHLKPFPTLIKEHRFGVVVVRQSIHYERSFNFFSAKGFTVRVNVMLHPKRHMLLGEVDFMNGEERFLRLDCAMRPLAIESQGDLSALPTRVDGAVLKMFRPDEVLAEPLERPMRKALAELAELIPVASAVCPLRLTRHECEAADQWSYIEVGANAARAREQMVINAPTVQRSALQAGLSHPISRIEIEIDRPLFLFDEAQIESRAYVTPQGLAFLHIYRSNLGGSHQHAMVLERMAP